MGASNSLAPASDEDGDVPPGVPAEVRAAVDGLVASLAAAGGPPLPPFMQDFGPPPSLFGDPLSAEMRAAVLPGGALADVAAAAASAAALPAAAAVDSAAPSPASDGAENEEEADSAGSGDAVSSSAAADSGGSSPSAAAPDAPVPVDEQEIWSAVVEIDPGFPFDMVWQGVQRRVLTALSTVRPTWPDMGWMGQADLELCLRQSVQSSGFGAVARGLKKAQAEQVIQLLDGVMPCSVREDREAAQLAATLRERTRALTRRAVPGRGDAPGASREQLRERVQAVLRRGGEAGPFHSMLRRMEADLADDERATRHRGRIEAALSRVERFMSASGDMDMEMVMAMMMLGGRGPVRVGPRRAVLTVKRQQLLQSAIAPICDASAEDLRPGRLQMKYHAEEGEDGEGGNGVTRAFLTQAGALLAEPKLGLFLPSLSGHTQLSPLPGYLVPHGELPNSVTQQPQKWSRFLGRLMGMAVAHEAPLGMLLVPSLCKHLVGEEPSFEDLQYVPCFSEDGSGWYTSLRNMLVHRADEELVKPDPGLVKMEDGSVNAALMGLDATMPSRTRMTFESLANYAASLASCPEAWLDAVQLVTTLLKRAKNIGQVRLVAEKAVVLVKVVQTAVLKGQTARSSDLSPHGVDSSETCSDGINDQLFSALNDLKNALVSLPATRTGSGVGIGDLEEVLHYTLAGMKETVESQGSTSSEPPAKRPRLADASEDVDLTKLKTFLASSSSTSDESTLSLEDETSQVHGPGIPKGSELSADNLVAFAEAVMRKALTENLQPQLEIMKKEFRAVVPKKVRTALTWQQVQDRISGKRLDPAGFIKEWQDKTTYSQCSDKDGTVAMWWEYVQGLDIAELKRLFTWCTGFAAIPITPWKFQIKAVEDVERCPTINSCMTDDPSAANRGVKMPTMYLPMYDSKETLAQKMGWSIAGASGMSLY